MLAILSGAALNASVLQPDTSVVQASVKAAGVDYSGQNLSGRDFAWNDFTGANFTGANLTGTNLQGANLKNANLTNANLTNASLVNTDLTGATLTGVTFTNARFNTGTIWPAGFNPLTKGMWGPGVDYSGQNLSGMDFAWNDFTGAKFVGTNLSGAKLWDVSFRNADLRNANLTKVDLSGADFTGADLTGTVFTGSRFNINAKWPVGYNPLDKGMWGPGVDYSGQNLSGMDFAWNDFTGAKFVGTNLSGAKLWDVSFRNADLRNANLTNLDLRGADFTGADLTGTVFTGSRFNINAKWPVGYNPLDTGMWGPGVDYSGQNLSGMDFAWNDFTGAKFVGTNLSGAKLWDVSFRNADLRNANLTNAALSGADFTGARYSQFTTWPSGFDPVAAGAFLVVVAEIDITKTGGVVVVTGSTGTATAYRSAFDTAGNFIVTGSFTGTVDFDPGSSTTALSSAGGNDGFIAKYSPQRTLLWARRFGGTGNDAVNAVAVSSKDAVCFGGRFESTAGFDTAVSSRSLATAGGSDGFVGSFDANGDLTWIDGYGAGQYDEINSLAIQPDGNVVVVGSFDFAVDFDRGSGNQTLSADNLNDVFILSLTTAGDFRWVRQFIGSGYQYPRDAAVGSDGSIAITGSFYGTVDFDPGPGQTALTATQGLTSAFIVKLNADGALVWAGNLGGSMQFGESIAVDAAGAVFASGVANGTTDFAFGPTVASKSFSGSRFYLAKYDTAGAHQWARTFGKSDSIYGSFLGDRPLGGVAVDLAGRVYSAGGFNGAVDFDDTAITRSASASGIQDAYLLQWSAATGELQAVTTYGGSGSDRADGIALSPFGHMLVAGTFASTISFASGLSASSLGSSSAFVAILGDQAPSDISLSATSVAENQPGGSTVGTLSTTDPDAGNTFTYSLVAGTGSTDNAAFNISGNQLRAAASLDFEAKNSYSIRVRSTDQGGLFTERVFTITVTNVNEAPTEVAISTSTLPENLPVGSVVGVITTSDPDQVNSPSWNLATNFSAISNPSGAWSYGWQASPDPSVVGFTRYTTVYPNGGRPMWWDRSHLWFNALERAYDVPTGFVSLHPGDASEPAIARWTSPAAGSVTLTGLFGAGNDGVMDAYIRANGSVIWSAMDFNTDKLFSITRTVAAGDTIDWLVTGGYWAGNTPVDASVSYSGDNFTYLLVPGAGDVDNASFEIVGGYLRTKAAFNHEVKNSYNIRVRSTDQGGLSTEKAFTITVTNVNETPTDISLSASSIAENAGANAVVGALSATDPDAGNTFTYTLVAGAGSTDNAAFNISGNQLRATASLNFEAKSSYSVRIRSTDQGGLRTEKTFTISVTNVNETPTDIALSASSIAENAGANAAVGTLSTTDPDASNTFTYTLVTGTGSTDNAAFNISGNQLRATASLNFEAKSSYSVRIRSADQGGLLTEKTFTIAVTNVNDTPTDIALSASSIAENQLIGTAIGTLSTTDQDAGGSFTYSFVAGTGDTDNASFSIVGNTLKTATSFNYEAKSSYAIRIRSTDVGGLATEKAFTIRVIDVIEDWNLVISDGVQQIDGFVRDGSSRLVKSGAGSLILDRANSHTGGIVVQAGQLIVRNTQALGAGRLWVKPGASVLFDVGHETVTVGSLTLESGGAVDVGYGQFSIAPLGGIVADVQEWLRTGYNTDLDSGPGIRSRFASRSSGRTVGYTVNWDGTITVGYAATGDTNLSGDVDILDVINLLSAGKFDSALDATWSDGDFNYDGVVDVIDLSQFVAADLFNQGSYRVVANVLTGAAATSAITAPVGLTTTDAVFIAFALESSRTLTTAKKSRIIVA